MAKNQSILRNAVDAVFAPSQYLTHDGAAYAQSKYAQIFNRVTKPHYLIFAGGVAALSIPSSVLEYGVSVGVFAFMTGLDLLDKSSSSLKDTFYDTRAQTRSFVDAPQASELKSEKFGGIVDMTLSACWGAAYFGSDIASGNSLAVLPFFCAWVALGFGNYWRPKQVLDGNWSLLNKTPPEKQTSKARSEIPANAVPIPIRINNREIAPMVEL